MQRIELIKTNKLCNKKLMINMTPKPQLSLPSKDLKEIMKNKRILKWMMIQKQP